MKDRINRTKAFVKRHRGSMITGVAGVAIGATAAHRYHLNVYQMQRWGLGITKEQLQQMLDDPTKTIPYEFEGIGNFNLSQIDLSKIQ